MRLRRCKEQNRSGESGANERADAGGYMGEGHNLILLVLPFGQNTGPGFSAGVRNFAHWKTSCELLPIILGFELQLKTDIRLIFCPQAR